VGDAHEAHARSIANGAVDVLAPRTLPAGAAAPPGSAAAEAAPTPADASAADPPRQVIAEVKLYGDVVGRCRLTLSNPS